MGLKLSFSRLPSLTKVFVLAFAAVAIYAISVRFMLWDLFEYKIWGDRALARSFFTEDGLPIVAAELKVLGRVPGNALYVIIEFLEGINPSPVLAYMFQVGLDVLAIAVVFGATLRYAGPLAASVAGVFYALSIPIMQNMVQLWNLGFVPLPAALVLYASLRVYVDRQYAFLLAIFLVAGIAVQFHLSFYLLLLAALTPLVLHLNRRSLFYLVVGLCLFFGVQWNYWAFEIANNFPNTSLIFANPVDATAGTQSVWTSIFGLVAKLSGGRILQLDQFVTPAGAFNAISMVLLNLFLVITYVGGLLSLVFSSGPLAASVDKRRREAGLLALFICGVTIIFVSLFSLGASVRYVLSVVPFVCAFAGIGFAALLSSRFAERALGGWKAAPMVLVGCFLFAMAGKSLYYKSFLPSPDLHTYSVLSRIIERIGTEFGVTGQAFDERVSLATSHEGGVISRFHPKKKFSYLSKAVFRQQTPGAEALDECVFVTTPQVAQALEDGEKGLKLRFDGLGESATVTRTVREKDFVLIAYQTASGNCAKSTSNPYVFTPSTSHLKTHWAQLGTPEHLARRAVSLGETHVFRAGIQGLFGGGVTLKNGPDGVWAQLFSINLKGSGGRLCPPGKWKLTTPSPLGIWNFTLSNPTLIFENNRSAERLETQIFDGALGAIHGSMLSGLQSPWEKRAIKLEKGDYTVSFAGRIKFRCSEELQDIRILLTENFDAR
jgi:hypothetical protein